LNLLIFRISLQPHGRHRLRVQYQQPAGVAAYHGGDEGFYIPGFHFAYAFKVRPSWASFGPIEVRVRIPEYFRLRASPPLKFAEASDGWRLYTATLQPYRSNLYVVVGSPETFQPRIIVTSSDGAKHEIFGHRFGARIYLPLEQWFHYIRGNIEQGAFRWDEERGLATISCPHEEKHLVVAVGKTIAQVHGEEVNLPASVRFYKGRIWIPVRALPSLTGQCFPYSVSKVSYDAQMGYVIVSVRVR
jgi:hypothetical protein